MRCSHITNYVCLPARMQACTHTTWAHGYCLLCVHIHLSRRPAVDTDVAAEVVGAGGPGAGEDDGVEEGDARPHCARQAWPWVMGPVGLGTAAFSWLITPCRQGNHWGQQMSKLLCTVLETELRDGGAMQSAPTRTLHWKPFEMRYLARPFCSSNQPTDKLLSFSAGL